MTRAALDDARLLLAEIRSAIARGTKHYRLSDDLLLTTPREILEALLEEGSVRLQFPEESERHES